MTHDAPILKTLEEAYALRQTLVDDLQRIQLELSNKDVRASNGRRQNGVSYHTWRQQRLVALTSVQKKLQYVKHWISIHSRLPQQNRVQTPRSRIQALELVFRRLKSYIEYNDSQGNGKWTPEEADERWQHILSAVDEVEKSKPEEANQA